MLLLRKFLVGCLLFTGLAVKPAMAQRQAKIEIIQNVSHSGEITSVAISPDGARAASAGGFDYTLKLWDVATGRLIRTFVGHTNVVAAVAFSPDGTRLLSGSWDRTFSLWNVATGKRIRTVVAHDSSVNSVAFSADGSRLVTGSWDNAVKLWDATSGKLVRSFVGHSDRVYSTALSSDGRRVLSGSIDKTVRLWDIATGQLVRSFSGHSDRVNTVAFAPDGSRVLSGSLDKTIKLWDAATGEIICSFVGHSEDVNIVAFSPDGLRLLSGSDDKTQKLWDVASGQLIWSFEGGSKAVNSVAFLPDGTRFISGGKDGTVKLWASNNGQLLRSFGGPSAWINSVAFSPDGTRLLAASGYRTVLWGTASAKFIRSFEGSSVGSRAFSPDGTRMLSGSLNNTLQLWDVASGKILRGFVGHSDEVKSVAFSPNGLRLLSGSDDKTMKLWDLESGQIIRSFDGHSGAVDSVAFSSDGLRLLSGSRDGTLKLWNADSGRLIHSIEVKTIGVNSAAFSPDGTLLLSGSYFAASSSDHTLLALWDAATGQLIRKFLAEDAHHVVYSVAFSPDGTQVLSGGSNVLKLWEAATGKLIRNFEGHSQEVHAVGFSPDGARVISSSGDATVRIWNTNTGELLASLSGWHDDKWLAMTSAGFFDGSSNAAQLLTVVRGLEVISIGQIHQSLYNPDLLREALAGDPNGELLQATKLMNLEKVLDSGPAPAVVVTSDRESNQSPAEVVKLTTSVTDKGKGVGRIEWRVNGLTVAVSNKPSGNGPIYSITQDVALDPGENTIEVVAYNASNLLASLPAQTTITFTAPADRTKPKLHILAIGIDDYVDRGYKPEGQSETFAFPPLGLAVKDATTFGRDFKRAAAGLYADVRLTTALNMQATRENLDKVVDGIAAEVHPRDTFILFAAAHGKSENGRFYLIPQDFQGGSDPIALAKGAIDQDRLQDWLSNRIKAKKAIIFLDTCESGALVGGFSRSRTDAPSSEAAVGRLHEATGRPILTATAEGNPAFEGYEGHGVFTWSLLDALRHADRNGNGTIELSELVAHVQDLVPKLSAKLNGRGLVAVTVRGSAGDEQSARFGSKGEDFVLAERLN